MPHLPLTRGLLLCDSVRADPQTGNVTLVNCFDRMTADVFPCQNRAFSVVAFLANGLGPLRIVVRIDHLEGERTIYAREHLLVFPDRLVEVRYRFQVTACEFPAPGTYEAVLFANRELITSTTFRLTPTGEAHG